LGKSYSMNATGSVLLRDQILVTLRYRPSIGDSSVKRHYVDYTAQTHYDHVTS
jgi:hypothetical protein